MRDRSTTARGRLRDRIPSIPVVVLTYWLVAVAWIIGSDVVLGWIRGDLSGAVVADMGKGVAFVTVTAGLILVLLERRERLLTAERARVAELQADLHDTERMDAVGRLARGTAHDVNNLLAVIRGHTDLARLDAPPEQLDSLDAIDHALDRAVALTRDLQTVAGRQNLDLNATDLGQYLAEQQAELRAVLPSGVELTLRRPEERIQVALDPARFDQVLLNLATNAADAMPDGGRLDITLRTEGPEAVIEVRDSGHGMDPEIARHCFEPFFSTKAGGNRSGMGLALAYGVVRQSGGRIDLVSQPGAGTTFMVILPLVSAQRSASAALGSG